MVAFTSQLSTPVRQPVLEAPLVSLVASARLRDEEGERWGNGVAFAPYGDPKTRTGAYDPCDSSYTKTLSTQSGDVEFNAIGIWGGDQCSTYGWESRDYVERAKSMLLASESFYLEQELWTAPVTGNPALAAGAGTTVVSGGPYAASDALMLLEQKAADTTTGNRLMFHCRPVVLGALVEARVVRRVGNLWLTYMDNVVVPGRGYPGTGPNGEAVTTREYMYATGIVEVIRGPIHHFPERPEQEIKRTVNEVQVFCDRLAVALFDPIINLAVTVLTPGAASIIAIE